MTVYVISKVATYVIENLFDDFLMNYVEVDWSSLSPTV